MQGPGAHQRLDTGLRETWTLERGILAGCARFLEGLAVSASTVGAIFWELFNRLTQGGQDDQGCCRRFREEAEARGPEGATPSPQRENSRRETSQPVRVLGVRRVSEQPAKLLGQSAPRSVTRHHFDHDYDDWSDYYIMNVMLIICIIITVASVLLQPQVPEPRRTVADSRMGDARR